MILSLKQKLNSFQSLRKLNYFLRWRNNKLKKYFGSLNVNSVFVDLGANIGTISQYVNDTSGGCKIFCYEPHPAAFKVLEDKFSKYENINLYQLAVSDTTKKVKFFFHKDSEGSSDLHKSTSTSIFKEKPNVSSSNFIYVKSIDFESLISKHDFIDILKVDIEGAEYKIIPSIIENRSKIGMVVCELHGKISPDGSNPQPFLNDNYTQTLELLKTKNLYGNWFFEWH